MYSGAVILRHQNLASKTDFYLPPRVNEIFFGIINLISWEVRLEGARIGIVFNGAQIRGSIKDSGLPKLGCRSLFFIRKIG